jgi:hypothetical protein
VRDNRAHDRDPKGREDPHTHVLATSSRYVPRSGSALVARSACLAMASACLFVTAGSATARADQIDACVDAAEQAQRLRHIGKLRTAREKLLRCSQPLCVSAVRADCTKWMAELEGVMPTVVIRALDAARTDLVDVGVYVDDELVAARLDGNDIPVDPGEHVFRFVRDGSAPVDQSILIRQGERQRILSVVFPAPAGLAAPASARSGAPAMPLGDTQHSRIDAAWPIAAVAVGGVALTVASTLWISGAVDYSSMASSCAPTHSCSVDAVDAAHRKLMIGDVVGGVGIALLAVGGGAFALGLTARPSGSHGAPGIALVNVAGRF